MAELSYQETALYDRQIRTWGMAAQRRMREAKVLIIGLDGGGSECVKNLVLAGIGNITLVEHRIVDQNIADTHFYITSNHIGASWCDIALKYFSEMNPNIKISINNKNAFNLKDEYFKHFDCIVLNNQPRQLQIRVNRLCRMKSSSNRIGFFSSRSVGSLGYILCDLGDRYTFSQKRNETWQEKTLDWFSLDSLYRASYAVLQKSYKDSLIHYRYYWYILTILEKWEDQLLNTFSPSHQDYFKEIKTKFSTPNYNQLLENIQIEVNKCKQFNITDFNDGMKCKRELLNDIRKVWHISVCPLNAMVGGFLGNFVMYFVQGQEQPLRNILLFDMWKCEAISGLFYDDSNSIHQKLMTKEKLPIDQEQIVNLSDNDSDQDNNNNNNDNNNNNQDNNNNNDNDNDNDVNMQDLSVSVNSNDQKEDDTIIID